MGTKLPCFELPNTVDGKSFKSSYLSKDKPKVIMFLCNHCPFVVHCKDEITSIFQKYSSKVEFVAISSNDVVTHPADSPEKMKEFAAENGWDFPYLYDETQEVAKEYQAVCTPDIYLFNKDNELVYHGRIDESSPGNGKPITGKDLRDAIDNVLNDEPVSENQYPSMGCNIKWRESSSCSEKKSQCEDSKKKSDCKDEKSHCEDKSKSHCKDEKSSCEDKSKSDCKDEKSSCVTEMPQKSSCSSEASKKSCNS